MKDSDLKRLFTTTSEHSGPGGVAYRSTGHGGDHQLWTFADTIVMSGWSFARLAAPVPTMEQFADGVLWALEKIRQGINGQATTVPARVGLTGILLPEGVDEIDLGWAKVRRADARDERFVKSTTLQGQLTGTNQAGETTIINYSGDLVVELEVPFTVWLQEIDFRKPWPLELRAGHKAIEEAVENLRLGLLLAFPTERVVVHISWQVIIDPFAQSHSVGWNDLTHAVNLMPTTLTEQRVAEWKQWAQRIGEHRTHIGVAVRRMLASVAERRTLEDILVDAVIVWENLFGARTETTLRVSSSLAWLLGSDAADRKAKQTEYKQIYGTRSDVVHGAAKVDEQKLQDRALKAVQISIDALKTAFEHRPELLAIKSSEDRSIEILHAGSAQATLKAGTKGTKDA